MRVEMSSYDRRAQHVHTPRAVPCIERSCVLFLHPIDQVEQLPCCRCKRPELALGETTLKWSEHISAEPPLR